MKELPQAHRLVPPGVLGRAGRSATPSASVERSTSSTRLLDLRRPAPAVPRARSSARHAATPPVPDRWRMPDGLARRRRRPHPARPPRRPRRLRWLTPTARSSSASASPRRAELLRRLGVEPRDPPGRHRRDAARRARRPGRARWPGWRPAKAAAVRPPASADDLDRGGRHRGGARRRACSASRPTPATPSAMLRPPVRARRTGCSPACTSGAATRAATRSRPPRCGSGRSTDAEIDGLRRHRRAAGQGRRVRHPGRGGRVRRPSIAGSDTNVVGLPLATLVRLAAEVGVELLPR